MRSLRAHVHNGRLVMNEPTDLPEGDEVELVRLDEVLARGGDFLDDEDRAELHAALRESAEQLKAGQLISLEDALARWRTDRRTPVHPI